MRNHLWDSVSYKMSYHKISVLEPSMRRIGGWNFPIALEFGMCLGSTTSEAPAEISKQYEHFNTGSQYFKIFVRSYDKTSCLE